MGIDLFYLQPEIKTSNLQDSLLEMTKHIAKRKLKKIDTILKRGEIDVADLASFGN